MTDIKKIKEDIESLIYFEYTSDKNGNEISVKNLISNLINTTYKNGQEFMRKKVIKEIENMAIETAGNSAKTVDQIIKLIRNS